MSHICYVKTQFKSIEDLRDACKQLGLKLEGSGTIRLYKGTKKADFCLRIPSERFDVGFVYQDDGSYSLVGDEMLLEGTYSYRSILGDKCNKLRQQYSISVLRRQAAKKNMNFSLTRLENNQYKVVLLKR